MENPTPEEMKELTEAYNRYADSHTIWDKVKTGSFLDDIPRVIPMKYGKTAFIKKCLEDPKFYKKWKK